MADLEDVYAGKTDLTEATPTEQVEQVEEVQPTGEESAPPAQETPPKEPEVDWRAEAEKAKKTAEEAERKARGLEQAIAAARAKAREQPAPSFNEDPQAFVERVRQETQEQVRLMRVEFAQQAARNRYSDYDEKEQVFADLAQANPYLIAQLQQANDPADFAYQAAKFHMEMQAAGGSVDALKAKLAADLQAERQAKFAKQTANLPKTLSGAAGTGRASSQVFTGPTSLEDIYAKKGK